jgi:hypothetical protein
VHFPRVEERRRRNETRVWSIVHDVAPVVTRDRLHRARNGGRSLDRPPGGADSRLLDEGADSRSAIEPAEAVSRLNAS